MKFFLLFIMIVFLCISNAIAEEVSKNNTFLIQKISLQGITVEANRQILSKIVALYENKKLTFTQIQKIQDEINKFYKNNGDLYVKVIIPEQDISTGLLKIVIVKAKVNKIDVRGNKYYSSQFIRKNFGFKQGEYLDYTKMMQSLILLNEYPDLKVKALPKKGKDFATTDIVLLVEDEHPFFATIVFDNLGSKDTAKNRVSTSIFDANMLLDGDEISLNYTFGLAKSFSQDNTKLLQSNYALRVGKYHTKINFGILKANYIALGDFSVLNLKGDTLIYTLGVSQALKRSIKNTVDISLNYSNKTIKNYLLNQISSEDAINEGTLSAYWKYTDVFNSISSNAHLSYGSSNNVALASRNNQDKSFTRINIEEIYNRYINETNNFLFSFKGQYSPNLLPIVDMYSIGGMDTVRGYEPSQQIGDSGFSTSLEWIYVPKLKSALFKNAFQISLFTDYAEVYTNKPVAGQYDRVSLMGSGIAFKANIKERYFASLAVGVPIHSSIEIKNSETKIYFVLGAKIW